MTRVKVCGFTREDDLEAAVEAGVDAVGVVCSVPVDTPRAVPRDRARELVAAVPPFVTSVLVTMPETLADAVDLVEAVEPDAVQVHDGLGVDELAELRERVGADVLRAVDADDLEAATAYDDVVDALVVDSVDGDGGGGTGETHDWDRTAAATADLASPVVLAGGLEPGNVADAIRTVEPFAVDVASGVEERGGQKDDAAVRAFLERARGGADAVERGLP